VLDAGGGRLTQSIRAFSQPSVLPLPVPPKPVREVANPMDEPCAAPVTPRDPPVLRRDPTEFLLPPPSRLNSRAFPWVPLASEKRCSILRCFPVRSRPRSSMNVIPQPDLLAPVSLAARRSGRSVLPVLEELHLAPAPPRQLGTIGSKSFSPLRRSSSWDSREEDSSRSFRRK